MVRIPLFLAALSFAAALSAAEPPAALPQAGPPTTLPQANIGLPEYLFKDVPPALIAIAAKPFQDTIQKTAGLNGNLVIAKDYKVLAEQLATKKLDIALFHGFEYAWVQETYPDLIPLVVSVPNCGKVQACLVVNVGSAVAGPKDLKGSCVAIHKGLKAHCQMYLDELRGKLPKDTCGPMKCVSQTPAEVLDDVANGICEAAIVDISSYQNYKNSKPGAGAWLKILAATEPLPPAIVVCRKDALSPAQMKAIVAGLVNCKNTTEGRFFLTFWNLKGFDIPDKAYQELVDRARKAHPEPSAPQK